MARASVLVLVSVGAFTALSDAPPTLAPTLPAFTLSDPLGRSFTDTQLSARGAIVVVTAPTLSQGDAQQAWSAALRTLEPGDAGPLRVMLEDMSQSWFRPIVLGKMKESYKPTSPLILLLDEGGLVRKALGVGEVVTVALAFAPGGKLVAVETSAGTAERAKRLLDAVRAGEGPR